MTSQNKYEFTAEQFVPFKDRMAKNSWVIFLITALISVVASAIANIAVVLILGIVIFVMQYFSLSRSERYYITKILIKSDLTRIEFADKNEAKVIEGNPGDFIFKKKISFGKTRTPYLAIYYKESLEIKQYEQKNDWDESKFDEVVKQSSDSGVR